MKITNVAVLAIGIALLSSLGPANGGVAKAPHLAGGLVLGGDGRWWWDIEGSAWVLNATNAPAWHAEWQRLPEFDLPVSPAEVRFLSAEGPFIYVVTNSDVGWAKETDCSPCPWVSAGPLPGGPVPVRGENWTKVKKGYRP